MPEYQSIIFSKLPRVSDSIFSQMSQLAMNTGAINVSQGFPDFSCDERLIELVNKAMRNGQNQYAPSSGNPVLRDKLAQKIEELYGVYYNPDSEITITSGATQALYTAISAFIREDDEALIFEPAYDSYAPSIRVNGGNPVYVEMEPETFSYDWNKIKRAITQRTKMIIINTPHNPTGQIFSEKDLEQLENIVEGSDIVILSDEVYEHIIFDGFKHHSPITRPKLAERTLVVNSFGKTWHNTGWKIGYCYGPRELMKEFRKVHQFTVFSVNTPIQAAYAEFIDFKETYLELSNFYQEKRDFFLNAIRGCRFTYEPSKGTYFQLLNYKGISDLEDEEFAIWLTKEKKLATIPLSPFFHLKSPDKNIRICFAKSNDTLERAAEILCKI